jgi:hypothetical protein
MGGRALSTRDRRKAVSITTIIVHGTVVASISRVAADEAKPLLIVM